MFLQASEPEGSPLGDTLVSLAQLVPITVPGVYHVSATAGVKRSPPVAGFFVVGLLQNGNVVDASACAGIELRADTDTQVTIGRDVECFGGDVLAVFVTQVSRMTLMAGKSAISAFLIV